MTIGQLAARTDASPDTIRYYEREGLLPKPARTAGNFRDYDEAAAERLRAIARAKRLGFTLADIRHLFGLASEPGADAAAVRAHASRRLSRLEAQIARLQRQRNALRTLIDACGGAGVSRAQCPILADTLEEAPGGSRRRAV